MAERAAERMTAVMKISDPVRRTSELVKIADAQHKAGDVLDIRSTLLTAAESARSIPAPASKASGLTEKEFVNAYSKYRVIHSEIGAPGEMEGAAGSSYVEIPLRLYGTLNTGKPFNLVGTVALRRVNDVPGSSAEERQWHVYTSDLKPRP